jgi:hypothetical protein
MGNSGAKVGSPKHPLHALTSYELRDYRRELERAIALLDKADPAAQAWAGLQVTLGAVIAEQEDRKRLADA